jgi:hypothetical protein
MTSVLDVDHNDQVVRDVLAPFARVQPVSLQRCRPTRRLRPRLLVAAAGSLAILAFASLAAAGAFGPLHGALISSDPPAFACNLIGQSAGQAETSLHQRGYEIEWRFQHWGTLVKDAKGKTPSAMAGYTEAPATVPADSTVWDITVDDRGPHALFVFVEAPNDRSAPTVGLASCQGG